MVAHNGSDSLPRVLDALASQTRQASAILAVDVSSTDDSGEILRKEFGERNVIDFDPRRGGYGAAVNAALANQRRLLEQGRSGSESGSSAKSLDPSDQWIWLIQDDSAPAPDALERLLDALERATTATVAGCKQLDWDNPRRIVDVGLKVNKWFDRFTMVNLDELDQGQYDDNADVFAVNAAGMLVRRDVWDALGGFDPALPGPGDDVDFCARVRLAGHRVLVVPAAKMFVVSARETSLGSPAAARRAAVYSRLKHAPAWQVPLIFVGTFFASIYWLFAGFLLKAPGHAVSMFGATLAGLLRPAALYKGRRSLKSSSVQSRSAHKGLLATPEEARSQLKTLRESLSPDDESDRGSDHGPSILEPTGDIHNEAIAPMPTVRAAPIVSALVLALLLAVLSLLALGRLLGAPALVGGALLPVSDSLSRIWQLSTDWWLSLGSGMAGHTQPFNYVLWFLGVIGFGNPNAAVLWVTVLGIPLSAMTAWLAAGAFARSRFPRIVVALLWAGAPVLQLSMGQGRIGALIAHIMIPLVVLGMVRAVGGAVSPMTGRIRPGGSAQVASSAPLASAKLGRPGTGWTPSWTASAAGGIALAIATAAAPTLFILAVVAVLVASIFLGRRGKTLWWVLLPSVAVYLPYAWSARGNWRALLVDPGVQLENSQAPLWQQLLGFAAKPASGSDLWGTGSFAGTGLIGDGSLASWVAIAVIGGPVVLFALIALLRPLARAGTVRTLWLVALSALALAYASTLLGVSVNASAIVTPFNGPAISVMFFALIAAALLGLDAQYRKAFDPSVSAATAKRKGKGTAITATALLLLSPVVSLGLWSGNQFMGNSGGLIGASVIQSQTAGTLPATASDRGMGPEASRTLVLKTNGDSSVNAALMQGSGTTLDSLSGVALAAAVTGLPGQESISKPDAATSVLRETVALILAGSGANPTSDLEALGIGFVVLENGDTAAELLAGKLTAVPGLETVGPTESGWLWRVKSNYAKGAPSDVINRVHVADAAGKRQFPVASKAQSVDAKIPAGSAGRKVILAENYDSGWKAWFNGKQLKASSSDWAQAFELPKEAGRLEIRYEEPLSSVLFLAQAIILGLSVLLAVPVKARRGRIGAYRDEASLHRIALTAGGNS